MKGIVVIEGDGIGREVIPPAVSLLEIVAPDIEVSHAEMGLQCYKERGEFLPDETLEMLRGADASLLGAITSPRSMPDYRSPLLRLREELGLFANVRPLRNVHPSLGLVDLDLVIFRENTEGMYSGRERREKDTVMLERVISEGACRRLIRFAKDHMKDQGRQKLTCVHKANVLRDSDGMFLEVFYEEMEGSGFEFEDRLVDATAAAMITEPEQLDCIVTLNMYGDILSDEGAALTGGLGLAPSGNLNQDFGLFEPCHGSAPDIAGRGIANPTAAMLSASMMLRFLGLRHASDRIERAVFNTLDSDIRTPDIGGTKGTSSFAEEVEARL